MPKTSRVIPSRRPEANSQPAFNGWDYLDQDDYLRVCVYGRSATGKSSFSSTFPAPILWLVCSGGDRPGELKSINTPQNRSRIDPKIILKSNDIWEHIDNAKASGKYETIVLDHASGLVHLIITEVKQTKEFPIGFAQSNAQAARGLTLVTEQEWGFIGAEVIKILRSILSLSMNSVIITQQKESIPKKRANTVDMSGESADDILLPMVGCALTPMAERWFYPAVDFILQTFIRPKIQVQVQPAKIKGQPDMVTSSRVPGKYEYCIRTGCHDLFTTKMRVPREYAARVPEAIVNPSFEKLSRLIKGQEVDDE